MATCPRIGKMPELPEVEATLRELDVDRMTPMQALVALAQLRGMLEG